MTMPKADFSGPDLCALPARDAVAGLRSGDIAPDDLLDAAFTRIAQVEPSVNATVTVCEDRARAAVKRLGADRAARGNDPGWLGGLPITIKDLTMVSGVRTTYGNVALKDFVPTEKNGVIRDLFPKLGFVPGAEPQEWVLDLADYAARPTRIARKETGPR